MTTPAANMPPASPASAPLGPSERYAEEWAHACAAGARATAAAGVSNHPCPTGAAALTSSGNGGRRPARRAVV
jgi:hypothetical protein